MEFVGITNDDLENVRALNRAWLEQTPQHQSVALSRQRLERLATAPFLLFSFHEQDEARWERLLASESQPDMFRDDPEHSDGTEDIQAFGLAFLWELARRNPFAARVISGAPSSWCERITSVTLVRLLGRVVRSNLLKPRFARDSPMHKRLFMRGSSAIREKRLFAQIAALQSILTAEESARFGRLPAVACRMPEPPRRVADKL